MSKFQIVAARVRMAARVDARSGRFDPGGCVRRELDGTRVSEHHYRRLCEEYGSAFNEGVALASWGEATS